MVKFWDSLQTRLTVSFIVLVLIVSSITLFYTYGETKKALKEMVRNQLMEQMGIVITQISQNEINDILSIKAGDEGSPKYVDIQKHLLAMRSLSKDMKNFYLMKKDGDKIKFILDDIYGTDPDYAKIDQVYESPDEVLMEGFNKIIASKDFYTDEWGTHLSCYAPLKNSNGETVAVIGVDMSAKRVMQKQRFLGITIYFVIGIAVLISGLIILFFSKTIINDINKMKAVAVKLSNGELDVNLPEIKSKNEVYYLNESLKGVLAALEMLIDTIKDKKEGK